MTPSRGELSGSPLFIGALEMHMTAQAGFYYNGRQIKPGDVFEVADAQHAKLINLAGRATCAPEQPQPVATQPRKGRYRRRDMRADQDD